MCSAWADAFGSWATAIEPCSSQMIYRDGKVNRLPRWGDKRTLMRLMTVAMRATITCADIG